MLLKLLQYFVIYTELLKIRMGINRKLFALFIVPWLLLYPYRWLLSKLFALQYRKEAVR